LGGEPTTDTRERDTRVKSDLFIHLSGTILRVQESRSSSGTPGKTVNAGKKKSSTRWGKFNPKKNRRLCISEAIFRADGSKFTMHTTNQSKTGGKKRGKRGWPPMSDISKAL